MHLSNIGLELLKESEGFKNSAYLDIAGFQTIGFGHKLRPRENYRNEITAAQAEALLLSDVRVAEDAVAALVQVPLTQGQFDALVDFVFNLGAGRLAGSTLLRYLNEGKYDAARRQLLVWDHAGSREIPGLKKRREAEFQLWASTNNQEGAAA